MHQQIPKTPSETLDIRKLEIPNKTLHGNDPCTANTQMQTLTQEEKTYIETIRRIMSEKKTTLSSLRNQDWRIVKSETEKVNDLLTNILTNSIAELHDLIYTGAKKKKKNNRGPFEDHRQKIKTRLGNQTWIALKLHKQRGNKPQRSET